MAQLYFATSATLPSAANCNQEITLTLEHMEGSDCATLTIHELLDQVYTDTEYQDISFGMDGLIELANWILSRPRGK